MSPGSRRRLVTALGAIALTITIVGWVIPTFAGRAFVEVTAHVAPIAGGPAGGRDVVLPDGAISDAARFRIQITITNRYPLPVLLDFRGPALRASLIGRETPPGQPAWTAQAEDPLLEQADESPDDGGSARVIVIPTGTTSVPATDDGASLTFAPTAEIAPGIYTLHVSAHGVAARPLLLSIVDVADASLRP